MRFARLLRPFVCGLGLLLVLEGCGSLASASAGLVGCTPDEITILDDSVGWGTRTWIAVCHGRRHQCSAISSQVSCIALDGTAGGEAAAEAVVAPTPPRPATETRRAEVAAALTPASAAVLACFPGVARVDLELLVAAQKNVYYFRAPRPLVRAERQCLLRAFSGHLAPTAASAVSVQLGFPHTPTDQPSTPTAVGPVATDTVSAQEGARVRSWLDAQRDAILACAERATVVVVARWDASGVVTLALGGDLAGSSNEGCVRTAVGAQRVTASAPGELRHLVR